VSPSIARSLVPVFLAVALLTFGNGMFGILLGLRLTLDGQSSSETGLVLGTYFIGYVLATLTVRPAIARLGPHRIYLAAALCAAAAVLGIASSAWLPLWAAFRFLIGYCLSTQFIILESWVNTAATNEIRGRAMGLYFATTFVAVAAAQVLVGVVDPLNRGVLVAVAVFYVISFVPSLAARIVSARPVSPVAGWARLAQVPPIAVGAAVGAGLINVAFLTLGPVYALGVGMDTAGAGRFMAAGMLGGLVLQWPAGWLADRYGRRATIAMLAAAGAAAAAAMALFGLGELARLAVVAVFGGATFALYPQASALANASPQVLDRVGLNAVLGLANGFGAMLAPFAAGAIMQTLGPQSLFGLAAGVGLLLAVAIGAPRRR
jgi:MFS family permease